MQLKLHEVDTWNLKSQTYMHLTKTRSNLVNPKPQTLMKWWENACDERFHKSFSTSPKALAGIKGVIAEAFTDSHFHKTSKP
jgi:hypothetical protein